MRVSYSKVKSVDFAKLLGLAEGYEELLGPEDAQGFREARILLQSQFPIGDMEKAAYITRSTQVQERLINTQSRMLYILGQFQLEAQSHYGNLLYREEYEGREKEKQQMALSQDEVYRDLMTNIEGLLALGKTLDHLLWSVKEAMKKV